MFNSYSIVEIIVFLLFDHIYYVSHISPLLGKQEELKMR